MDEVAVNINDCWLAGLLMNDVGVPNFLVERFRYHGRFHSDSSTPGVGGKWEGRREMRGSVARAPCSVKTTNSSCFTGLGLSLCTEPVGLDPPRPRCFLTKSVGWFEKKRIESLRGAEKGRRSAQECETKEGWEFGIVFWPLHWGRVPEWELSAHTPAVFVRVAKAGLTGYGTWKSIRKMGDGGERCEI